MFVLIFLLASGPTPVLPSTESVRDYSVEDIVLSGLTYATAIQSVEFTYQEQNYPRTVDGAMGTLGERYVKKSHYRTQGSMWRNDEGIDGKSASTGRWDIDAFDGEKIQKLYRNDSNLAVRRNARFVPPSIPPTLRTFSFAFDDNKENGYEVLKPREKLGRAHETL
jgi:hypothetical protein